MIRERLRAELTKRGWRAPEGVSLLYYKGSRSFGYDEEPLIRGAVEKIGHNTLLNFERLATLWQQVRYLDRSGIPGCFAECGVWKGGAVGLMALSHLHSSPVPSRHLHLFDSFEGLPQPNKAKDGVSAIEYSEGIEDGKLDPHFRCVGPLQVNRDLLEGQLRYPPDLLHYHVGWFQDTIAQTANGLGDIALLRLDADWYDATKLCLETLYEKVVPGGVVVIDDYGHWEGCRTAVDEFIANLNEPVLLNHIDYGGRYWVRVRRSSSVAK
jgi:O-methyltransferase